MRKLAVTRQLWRTWSTDACGVLAHVPPAIIANLLTTSSDGRGDRLLHGLPPAVRRQVLRHLDGDR